jgi:hypothetical protein
MPDLANIGFRGSVAENSRLKAVGNGGSRQGQLTLV